MKFVIDIIFDAHLNRQTVTIYGIRHNTPYTPGICEPLYHKNFLPGDPGEVVFDYAIALACRLKTAGFAVDVTRSGG